MLQKAEEERKAEERRRHIRNNFSDYLNTEAKFRYNPVLGGIEDLFITVSNTSEYRFDVITVTVEYIKDSGGIYKTEEVEFNRIKAKGNLTLRAPNSSRGTKVNLYISSASSERLNFFYNKYAAAGGVDPYRMR